jgi:hypothetical protein
LPTEDKVDDPNLTAGVKAIHDKIVRPQRTSAPGKLEEERKAKLSSGSADGDDLSRLYSSPASSFGLKARLDFKTKSGAGSKSSMEQAEASALPRQLSTSIEESSEAPAASAVSKQLQNQISPRNSIGDPPLSPRYSDN